MEVVGNPTTCRTHVNTSECYEGVLGLPSASGSTNVPRGNTSVYPEARRAKACCARWRGQPRRGHVAWERRQPHRGYAADPRANHAGARACWPQAAPRARWPRVTQDAAGEPAARAPGARPRHAGARRAAPGHRAQGGAGAALGAPCVRRAAPGHDEPRQATPGRGGCDGAAPRRAALRPRATPSIDCAPLVHRPSRTACTTATRRAGRAAQGTALQAGGQTTRTRAPWPRQEGVRGRRVAPGATRNGEEGGRGREGRGHRADGSERLGDGEEGRGAGRRGREKGAGAPS
jgi:hypothetical protein